MTKEPIRVATAVPPLRKRKQSTGEVYSRRTPVEQLLAALHEISIEEVARRSEILDSADPEYIPPEAVMHFVRFAKNCSDQLAYKSLFRSLRQRFLQLLRVNRKSLGGDRYIEDSYQAAVRDAVVDNVTEKLCHDRNAYDDRLDYFEINFNSAVARARRTAKRDSSENRKRENCQSLEAVVESADLDGVDTAIRSLRDVSEKFEDFSYRSGVYSAISLLPDEERQVIQLLVEGFKIKEIAELVGCTEKTVSARRNRARAKLREELYLEDRV
ncbi:RNA polymerase sigma factor [Stieleria maiorica]|uniref:RNA polymerase sigma factor n=1 Tax=Stieleria maiorica TaxID=2795974 RepID=A0A5B9MPF8_9BACT|nr:sigma-70 family RNA polymerase sigma factor [Stieleria maiorica]QEG01556.1 RNA polymerase sigma factor [Stieleria maiorica]